MKRRFDNFSYLNSVIFYESKMRKDNIFCAHIITNRANVVPNIPVIKTAMIASFENTTWDISSTIKLVIKDNKAEIGAGVQVMHYSGGSEFSSTLENCSFYNNDASNNAIIKPTISIDPW